MDDTQLDHFLELVHAYLERSLNPEQFAELEARLASDKEARRVFVGFTHDHAILHWEQIPSLDDAKIEDYSDFRPRRFPTRWQAFAAAAVVSLLALVLVRPGDAETFATMQLTESAQWESGELPTATGARLGPGALKLVRGLATIRFDRGADVILEAPAELELVDPMHCVLRSGTVVAEVGESAKGFTIATPSARVIDHGTRFAVNVDPRSGTTRTRVFEGLVEVRLPSGHEGVELKEGQQNSVAGDRLGLISSGLEEETWARGAHPRLRDGRWELLSTAHPGGHDGYVWGGSPNDHVSDELLLLKNSKDAHGPHRKAYLRFDLSGVVAGAVEDAELSLRFTPTGWGLASHLDGSEFHVYGISQDSLDDWDFATMNWENAPANVTTSGTALDPDSTVFLGSFEIARGIQSGTFGIRGKALVDFLNADQNRLASLVVVRNTAENRPGGLVHAFASARHPSLPAPVLALRLREE